MDGAVLKGDIYLPKSILDFELHGNLVKTITWTHGETANCRNVQFLIN